MDTPLIGSRENNYRFFYLASGSAISSLAMLLIITGYTAYISTHVGHLMSDMTEVVDDIRVILPDVEKSLNLLSSLCSHNNFTDTYGDLCDV